MSEVDSPTHQARILRIHVQIDKMPTDTGWQERHRAEWARPTETRELTNGKRMGTRGIVGLIKAWAAYADDHMSAYGSGIGEDHVLGNEWADIGYALLGMLNGELGAMDGGTLDRIIRESLDAEGFNADTRERKA